MSNIEQLTQELRVISEHYLPSPDIQARLADHEFVAIVGPFATGKTTIMEAAQRLDSDFGRLVCDTTRPQRAGEHDRTYNFRPHTEETLLDIRDKATAGSLLQLVVHPTTGNVYSLSAQSLDRRYVMLDLLPSAVDRYASMPFNDSHIIGLTTYPNIWHMLFKLRNSHGDQTPADTRQRLAEGVSNIQWCLDKGDSVKWVVNPGKQPNNVAQQIIDIVKGRQEPSSSGLLVAQSLHSAMATMLSEQ